MAVPGGHVLLTDVEAGHCVWTKTVWMPTATPAVWGVIEACIRRNQSCFLVGCSTLLRDEAVAALHAVCWKSEDPVTKEVWPKHAFEGVNCYLCVENCSLTHDFLFELPPGTISYNVSLRMLVNGKAGDTLVACPWRMASCGCSFCVDSGLQQLRISARKPSVLPVASKWTYHERASRSNMWWDRVSFTAAELQQFAVRPPAVPPFTEYTAIWDADAGAFVDEPPGEGYPPALDDPLEMSGDLPCFEGSFRPASVIVAVGRFKRKREEWERQHADDSTEELDDGGAVGAEAASSSSDSSSSESSGSASGAEGSAAVSDSDSDKP